MVLQNRAGNLAKTETSAPFISDVKVECRCLTAQSKSSFFFFPDIKMISTLQQDFSRDNIGFTLPPSSILCFSSVCFQRSLFMQCQTSHYHLCWYVESGKNLLSVTALPSPKAMLFMHWPVSHYLCTDITFVYLPLSCPAGQFYSNSPQQCSLQVQSGCL